MNIRRMVRDKKHARQLSLALKGNSDAFRLLYRDLYKPVASYLRARVNNEEDAEDLISQVFQQFVEKLDQYDSKRGSVLSWILTTAHHAMVDHYRSRKKTLSIEEVYDGLSSRPGGQLEEILRDEMILEIQKLVSELPADTRQLFALRFDQDLRYREIAEILGLSEVAVKQRFSRAIRSLKNSWREKQSKNSEVDYAV